MRLKNLTLIGTSHIAKESINEVKNKIEEESPSVICVEIDKKRLPSLFSKSNKKPSFASIRKIGLKGYLFALIGAWAEKKMGDLVGISPGEEMKTAIKLAKKKNIPLVLIDQDIEITLKRFSEELTWKEKWRFLYDILHAIIFRKSGFEFDIRKVPKRSLVRLLLKKVKTRYPNVYKVLIEERNVYMAARLKEIINQHPNEHILAVVGAGHEEGIINHLERSTSSLVTYSVRMGG